MDNLENNNNTIFLKELLDLGDDVIVKDVKKIGLKDLEVTVEMEKKKQICPHCGSDKTIIKDYRTQKVKDAPIDRRNVYILYRKRRYECKCGKTFYEDNSIVAKHQKMTKKVHNMIFDKTREVCSFSSIGRDLNISVTTVIRVFDKITYSKLKIGKEIEAISIDEFKGNTGGEKYNCIIADPKNKVVLDILPKRYSHT